MNSCRGTPGWPTSAGSKLIGSGGTLMTGTTPVPLTGTTVTTKGVLVVSVTFALLVMVATGVNVIARLQLAFGATGPAHCVASTVKTGSLETAAESDSGAVPQFVRTRGAVVD